MDEIDGFLLDLDGTCYLGGRAIPGAPEFVARCREAGKRVLWVTNNCSRSAPEYADKLRRLGFAALRWLLAVLLAPEKSSHAAMIWGSLPLRQELS